VVANGGAGSRDDKDASNGVSGAEATHRTAAADDAPQRSKGVDGRNHVTATVGSKSAVANGVARVEVELLDGSAKDVKVLGAQGAVATAVLPLVALFLQEAHCTGDASMLCSWLWSSNMPHLLGWQECTE